jgi:hypothetical protein
MATWMIPSLIAAFDNEVEIESGSHACWQITAYAASMFCFSVDFSASLAGIISEPLSLSDPSSI